MNEQNSFVSRDSLFGKPLERRFADSEVAGFGKFRIRSITAGEQNKLNRKNYSNRGTVLPDKLLQANARFLVACVVDADGNQIFSEQDVPQILELDAKIIENVIAKCSEHCGFDDEAAEKN